MKINITSNLSLAITTLFVFLLVPIQVAKAQGPGYINGRVIDAETKEPVPFSTLLLKQQNKGLVTNSDGSFRFKLLDVYQKDSVIVSCIGYHQRTFAFSELRADSGNLIHLEPSTLELDEFIISAQKAKKIKLNPRKIVQKAIENIPMNNLFKLSNHVAYYRDYQKQGDDYINLNEAIIQTFDTGLSSKFTDNTFRLLDFKENKDFPRKRFKALYDTVDTPDYKDPNKYLPEGTVESRGGNELFILLAHDVVRNFNINSFSFVYLFAIDFIENHHFIAIEPVYNGGLLLYKIGFKVKNKATEKNIFAKGNIYIQPDNYAIHKFEYTCGYINTGKNIFDLSLEYGNANAQDSLMRLKYISFNNLFKIVDAEDEDYFRVKKSSIGTNQVEIQMSDSVDVRSALNKKNYEAYLGDTKLKISRIIVRENTIIIKPRNKHLQSSDFKLEVKNILDVNGRKVNQKRVLEYLQFRELFVQAYDQQVDVQNNDCLLSNKPLQETCIGQTNAPLEYWMNTPIKNGGGY